VYFLNGIPIKNVKNWDRQKFGQKFGNLVVVGGREKRVKGVLHRPELIHHHLEFIPLH
jgi:hypothetical protein